MSISDQKPKRNLEISPELIKMVYDTSFDLATANGYVGIMPTEKVVELVLQSLKLVKTVLDGME